MALDYNGNPSEKGVYSRSDSCLEEDILRTSGILQMDFAPTEVTAEGNKIYKVSYASLGYHLVVQLPWWVARATLIQWEGDRRINCITACDKVKGIPLMIIVECLTDRRGESLKVDHYTLMRHFCNINWFSNNSLALYYTDFPSQGFQTYTVLSKNAAAMSRRTPANLLTEFTMLRRFYQRDEHKNRLSPVCQDLFVELMTYFTKNNISSVRQLKSTVYKPGLTLLKKLFVCEELHRPSPVRNLLRLCAVATALFVKEPQGLGSLRLPLPVNEEVKAILYRMGSEAKSNSSVGGVTPPPILNPV